MSKEVKRYGYGYVDDGNGNRFLGLIEKPDGNLVKHEDYESLLAERDAVERALLIAKSDIKVEQRVSANLREHKNDYMDAAEVTRKALLAEIETLKAERDALRKDSERLDWLDGYVVSAESEDTGKIAFSSIRGALRECVDAAIDAALQGAQP